MSTYSIFLIEDEIKIAKFIQYLLEKEGYLINSSPDYKFNYDTINSYDLFIIDVNLPYVNGFDIARRIKSICPNKPIIFLTALNQIQDKIQGLSISEDYITKPFEPLELLARVENLINLFYPSKLMINNLDIDLINETISKNEERINLTETERKIFFRLAHNLNKKISKEDLIYLISNDQKYISENQLNVYINSIRKKIDKESCPIETIYGYGYIIRS